MSRWQRILHFPLSRILFWALATFLFSAVLGLVPFPFERRSTTTALAMVLGLILLARVAERRPIAAAGLGLKHALRDLVIGFGIAAAMFGGVIGMLAIPGWYRVSGFAWDGSLVAHSLYVCLMVGFMEEIAIRGVVFRVLEESLGSWISLGLSGLLFGLLHLGNPNASLMAALAIAVEAGIMLGAAYMLTRSLWLAIGIHWGWNFVQGTVFGAAVSGGQSRGLLHPVITGPELATGGAFGPEAGLPAMLIGLGVGVGMLWLAWRRDQIVPPSWRAPRPAAREVAE